MAQNVDDTSMDCIWYYDFEIIGNIYENPDLLASTTQQWKHQLKK